MPQISIVYGFKKYLCWQISPRIIGTDSYVVENLYCAENLENNSTF